MTGCTLRICLVRDNRHFFRDLTAAADTQARTPASAGLRMVAPDTQARTPNGSAGLRMVAPDTHARTPNGSAGLRMVAPDTHARTPNGSAGLHHPARNARLRESDGHPDHSGSWGVQVAPPNSPASRARRRGAKFQWTFSPWLPPPTIRGEKVHWNLAPRRLARDAGELGGASCTPQLPGWSAWHPGKRPPRVPTGISRNPAPRLGESPCLVACRLSRGGSLPAHEL